MSTDYVLQTTYYRLRMKVVTRFPPSPTGYFHIGSARTALFNYLFAAHEGGVMYLRFEDTDKERSRKEYEEDILAGLAWLGIKYEMPEHPRQSERTHVYQNYVPRLIKTGAAYEAEESKMGGGRVVRFKNPNTTVRFTDLIRGEISFDTAELKDFIIARNLNEPLYHLAVVIDDHEMGVSHIIRGEDHISNTQRQILILEALGFKRPEYAHIPLILAPDRTKLSKRHGALSVNEYRAQGYLPEALVNYLTLLGWNPGGVREIYSLEELVEQFDIAQIQKSSAIFDIEKLQWFNREYIRRLSDDAFERKVAGVLKEVMTPRGIFHIDPVLLTKLTPLLKERVSVWDDIRVLAGEGELDYFFMNPRIDPPLLPGKNSDVDTAKKHLVEIRKMLGDLPSEDFKNVEAVKTALWDYATREGRGAVLWPFRYALTGKERSPDPFTISAIIGKHASLLRIDNAYEILKGS